MSGFGKSKWFNSYNRADFDFSSDTSDTIDINSAGVSIKERAGNKIVFKASDPDFHIDICGFDKLRDIHVEVRNVEVRNVEGRMS